VQVWVWLAIAVAATPVAVVLWRYFTRVPSLQRDLATGGENVILGPVRGYFQGGGDYVSVRTLGAAALTEQRLVFRQPIGRDIVVPLADIREMAQDQWFKGNYRSGLPFLILSLADGRQVGFQLPQQERWREEIRGRIGG